MVSPRSAGPDPSRSPACRSAWRGSVRHRSVGVRSLGLPGIAPPACCEGDPTGLAQVVTNLLSNAIRYNRPAGTARVELRREGGGCVMEVADTGSGIPEADLEHVFGRFYRVDKSRSSRRGGSGLGLAISKAIVEAHGGSIDVASIPGEGTVFTVRFTAIPPGMGK